MANQTKNKKGDFMKKIVKILTATAGAVMGSAACIPATLYADENVKISKPSTDKTEMETALKIVKQRVTIPAELSEFSYETQLDHGKKLFAFTWYTPDSAETYKEIKVAIVGKVIVFYSDGTQEQINSDEPTLAALTEAEMLDKAKASTKQLNPDIYTKMKYDISNVSLFSNVATVKAARYENNIPVTGNGGTISIDKNTGKLIRFSIGWWEDAVFADSSKCLTERQMEEKYQELCKLTPYYRLSSEWNSKTNKFDKKFTIVYEPDTTKEMDAFTGSISSIWDDKENADGDQYYYEYSYYGYYENEAVMMSSAVKTDGAADDVAFTEAELKKIEQDNSLISEEKATEILKKDKYVALTDNYKAESYNIYSQKKDSGEETFIIKLNYKLQKGNDTYKNIQVSMDAKSGKILSMSKYNNQRYDTMPKLNASKANTIAANVATTYAKDVIAEYKPDQNNIESMPVPGYYNSDSHPTSKTFKFNRYVNDIQVSTDTINVTVDSLGEVTEYNCNYTEDVPFPDAKVLSSADAFKKLYKQRDFDLSYEGWVTEDGTIHTYLIYDIDGFRLNAKTGQLCSYDGHDLYNDDRMIRDMEYTDIKGIPQEEAIRALQKYNIGITTGNEFKPNQVITEAEFQELLSSAFGYHTPYYATNKSGNEEALKEGSDETTMKEAAAMFGQMYLDEDIASLSGVFKSPFRDVPENDPDVGYIAVAKAKSFVKGTKIGNDNITRAEAIQMVYDYLTELSK